MFIYILRSLSSKDPIIGVFSSMVKAKSAKEEYEGSFIEEHQIDSVETDCKTKLETYIENGFKNILIRLRNKTLTMKMVLF